MSYVDGFVAPIPEGKLDAYRAMAEEAAAIWKRHGALQYFECIGDDLNPTSDPAMKAMTFPELVQPKKGETVLFAFIVYKSREHRDEVNKAVMAEMDERYKDMKPEDMPFDMRRMTYGGFQAIVEE